MSGVDSKSGPDPLRVYRCALVGAGGKELDSREQLLQGAVAVALYESPPYDLTVPGMATARLSISLLTSPGSGAIDGDRPRNFSGARHSVCVTPAEASARWRKPARSRHINLYFHAQQLADPMLPAGMWDSPMLDRPMPTAGRLAAALARELTQPGPCTELALEALARLVLVEVARGSGRALPGAALSPRLLARLDEFMRAHLADRLLVRDLASVVGLSASHFAHAHVRATGKTPHRRLVELRVEQALHLIRTTRRPLVHVAAECGFASQQHMTQVLRKCVGSTPRRLRGEGPL